jgi:hypothetical protein
MRPSRITLLVACLAAVVGATGFTPQPGPSWRLVDTGVTARLRGLVPVSAKVIWASGSGAP